jgi:thioesterase domain-containing protein
VRGLYYKVARRARWSTFEALVAAGLPLPSWLKSVERVNRRAVNQYVTPASPGRVTLFRVLDAENTSFFRKTFWTQIAEGGVDIRPVVSPGATHFTMMEEPHVRALAQALDRAISDARATTLEAQEPSGAEAMSS